jgi:hypothetical protein
VSPQQEERLAEALRHVEMGFWAFPVWSTDADGVCKCPKGRSCGSPGKHPVTQRGFHDATQDPKRLRTLMSAGSEPNYGLVWPEGGDIVVTLDVDGADWHERIDVLKGEYGPLPPTKTTRTPSGGLHLFYRWPTGVPVPETNHLHGFVARFPMAGYVVGPLSRINGKMYTAAGPDDMAVLPESWALAPREKPPLIEVTDEQGYELPLSIPTGSRHDEVTKFVASRWNHRVTKVGIEAEVRQYLVPLMDEKPSEAKLRHDIDEAWDTAVRKWKTPAGGEGAPASAAEAPAAGRTTVEVGLLDPAAPKLPDPMRREAYTTSSQVAFLLDHFKERTDAGYEGLTVTSLVYLGALMGHAPTAYYGSREQHTNIMAMLVGASGKSRKGTTVSLVRSALAQVTDGVRGMKQSANSGEGLIALAAKAEGAPILIEEEEFDRFLAAKSRESSTLSSILRQAFDDIPLTSSTAQKTVRADVHHVALLGNVTREEVTEKMERVDLKNGFANRILWTGVFPRDVTVSIHDNVLPPTLRDAIRDAIAWASALPKPFMGSVTHTFDPDARDALAAAAERYNEGVGLAPFLSRRLDTIAARIALIYACLDQTRVIEPLHVEAALALTDYAKASASWVFPETTGDADADLVLRHLKVAGFLDGVELEALVGKRAKDKQMVADLLGLMGYARVAERPRRDGKPGRPRRGLELT